MKPISQSFNNTQSRWSSGFIHDSNRQADAHYARNIFMSLRPNLKRISRITIYHEEQAAVVWPITNWKKNSYYTICAINFELLQLYQLCS